MLGIQPLPWQPRKQYRTRQRRIRASPFHGFHGTDEVLVDNPKALVVHHDAATREVEFNERFLAFAAHWRFRPRACAPYRARTEGKDENGVRYVKRNAIAGHPFESLGALEAHLVVRSL